MEVLRFNMGSFFLFFLETVLKSRNCSLMSLGMVVRVRRQVLCTQFSDFRSNQLLSTFSSSSET